MTQTKSFQEATENKYVKKLMHVPSGYRGSLGVSDTPLILAIRVRHIGGTAVINIPPPPSDRLWYGFLSPPKISLQAIPKVGGRTVNVANITEWIEKKLISLVEKALVIPNMDDIILPTTANQPLFSTYI
ncbi:unnamed protein product [Soboliphyme baturini]|uniref:WS_DGAT_C domain-containing protein n=1 Tax=Soboliphyme baturini TaxID=241478 RepID=A0A183IX59_9BILA|nr:unnamed protein product [Soboliphyme baturini]